MLSIETIIIVLLLAYTTYLLIIFFRYTRWIRNFPRLESTNASLTDRRKVSIVVPVRNQEKTVGASISSLIAQDYSEKEIVVVEGNSSDNTLSILENYAKHLIIVVEPPLPRGWVGKNWACHIGYRQSSGDVLLFTDGDIIHAHATSRLALSAMCSLEADLLTLWPKMLMHSFWEKVVLPLIFLSFFVEFEGKKINQDSSSKYAAFGPFILITRKCYITIGGHESIRDSTGEDYRMAELVKSKNFRLRVLNGSDFISTRMYSSLKEIWNGFLKNEFEGFDYKVAPTVTSSIVLLVTFVLPYFVLGSSLFLTQQNYFWILGLLPLAVTLLGTSVLYKLMGYDWKYSVLAFLAALIYLGIRAHSVYLGLTGRKIAWKGRKYRAKS